MSVRAFDSAPDAQPLAEINMIPLIDVMLVLLVIFIITAPLMTHAVKVDLPRASSAPNDAGPKAIQLSIRADGGVYWNGEAMDSERLKTRMTAAATSSPQPELHLRADRTAQYQKVAEIMSHAARAGLTRIGFITEPESVP